MEKKRIVIFEDSENDLISRYKNLKSKNYEIFVYLHKNLFDKEMLQKEGFNNIHKGLPKKLFSQEFLESPLAKYLIEEEMLILNEENPIEGDYYFSDGLETRCFELIENLPKEKVFINSREGIVQEKAKKEGYNFFNPNNF